jgi:hypothetical protein
MTFLSNPVLMAVVTVVGLGVLIFLVGLILWLSSVGLDEKRGMNLVGKSIMSFLAAMVVLAAAIVGFLYLVSLFHAHRA